jgi:primosomal protein N' (replication factor Y)
MQMAQAKYARVVIPSPLKEPLIYAIPPPLDEGLRVGMRVLVPLGKRKVAGVVLDFLAKSSLDQVREVLAVLDEQPVVDHTLLELSLWAAGYYLSSIGEVLATLLPPSLKVEGRRIVRVGAGDFPLRKGLQRKIFEEVRRKEGKATIKALARKFPGRSLYRVLDRLNAMGAVEIQERIPRPRTKKEKIRENREVPTRDREPVGLTSEQQAALRFIRERLNKGDFETFLLYGVTGSGKTEVYLRAMEEARRAWKRSLILVPEISLTPQLLDRLRERFPDRVGVLHSALTSSERWAQWWRIVNGDADVVVGARSAIFAPVPDLGLIVVDEEHDPSYKQEEGFSYHARDLAVVRGKLVGCPVLLGSATPAIESFENCRQGRYHLLELTERVERRPLPDVKTVDLKLLPYRDIKSKSPALLSPPLEEALKENFAQGHQSLIFLNRRGFANYLQCRLCGSVLRCSQCSVAMTFHLSEQSVFCHHCGFRKPAHELCPECSNPTLSGIGFGTEQVEQELSRLLPRARIARMDRDTTSRRGSQEKLVRRWEKGEIDILVGTQMITKGHDVSAVTLVGVVLADLSLNLPDFRAVERTFQLLSQVAGRAGRGSEPGRVIIQTYTPDHYAFQHVMTHDYQGFFASEIEFRRALNYPPMSRLVHLRVEGPRAEEVKTKAKLLGDGLRERQKRAGKILEQVEVLGPAPAPIAKLRGRYRWQILLKGSKGSPLLEFAEKARQIIPPSRAIRIYITVDPYNML